MSCLVVMVLKGELLVHLLWNPLDFSDFRPSSICYIFYVKQTKILEAMRREF